MANVTIQDRFESFHSRRPDVFRAFKAAAKEFKDSGEKVGSRIIGEYVRDTGVSYDKNFDSRYMRLLQEKYKSYRGQFSVRNTETLV